jgi:hypothetical protein
MAANVVNQIAYLRSSREYPDDLNQLCVEVSRTYIDVANAVNSRTIGIFPKNRPAITGNSYFFTNERQQSLRQVYTFTTTADIPLGFKISTISQFIETHGLYVSGTSTFGLIPATSVAIPGQITYYFVVDGTSTTTDLIRFVVGAGAPPLSSTSPSGTIVVEWVSRI